MLLTVMRRIVHGNESRVRERIGKEAILWALKGRKKRFVPILRGLFTTASKRRSARLLYSLPPNDDELPYYPKQHRALPCL